MLLKGKVIREKSTKSIRIGWYCESNFSAKANQEFPSSSKSGWWWTQLLVSGVVTYLQTIPGSSSRGTAIFRSIHEIGKQKSLIKSGLLSHHTLPVSLISAVYLKSRCMAGCFHSMFSARLCFADVKGMN